MPCAQNQPRKNLGHSRSASIRDSPKLGGKCHRIGPQKMLENTLQIFDVVVTSEDFLEQHVACGRRGTVVLAFENATVGVEFGDLDELPYAAANIPVSSLVYIGNKRKPKN